MKHVPKKAHMRYMRQIERLATTRFYVRVRNTLAPVANPRHRESKTVNETVTQRNVDDKKATSETDKKASVYYYDTIVKISKKNTR